MLHVLTPHNIHRDGLSESRPGPRSRQFVSLCIPSCMLSLVLNYKGSWQIHVLLVLADIFLSLVIVYKIAYTEIDWIAYMEEVQGFLDGERDYTKIQGNTGPLVYPAGFLYIFALLKWFTENGTNIFTAQIIFVGIYLMTLVVVLALYSLDGGISVFASILLVLSKRIHSIYMLRMFNDCIAVLCGYIAVLLFTKKSWRVGCLIYSLGVSVKMNMLLYAPGVLLVLLLGTGYTETFICLSICAAVQILLGLPFLTTYPVQYLMKAFELSRVFTYKWTVNFKFLPEEVFVSKPLSLLLLALTVVGIVTFAAKWIQEIVRQQKTLATTDKKAVTSSIIGMGNLSPRFILVTIFTSNFIGVACARTLHYQFYCWYFHTLPYLLWHVRGDLLPAVVKVAIFGAIELCFNVFPATWWSSALLQVCHMVLLVGLYLTPVPAVRISAAAKEDPVVGNSSDTGKKHLRKVD